MKMKFKVLCMAFVIGALMVTLYSPIVAADVSEFVNEEIGLRYTYTIAHTEALTVKSGTATATATLLGYSTTTKVETKMYLQQSKSGSWTNVKSWSGTFNGSSGTLKKTATVAKGSYRMKVVYTVYSGTKKETITAYSTTVKY